MGQAVWRGARCGREGRAALGIALLAALLAPLGARAQQPAVNLSFGRFTIVADSANLPLARSLVDHALRTDTFPGLPRPRRRATIAIAADARQFREWIGPSVPEWGSAVAFPSESRIVMQGRGADSRAGDPFEVLRHELAHLALHEALGDLTPRWFDEGYASYAAREWSREDALRANVALAIRGTPTLDDLERWFAGGASRAEAAYALAYRAVAELAALDPQRGLSVFVAEWARTRKLDSAIRNAYGLTLAGFEQRWRDRTRRRYGGLAVLADVTVAGMLVFLIVLPLYAARRQRDRRRMAALVAADEAAEREARQSALEALLGPHSGDDGPAGSGDGPVRGAGEAR